MTFSELLAQANKTAYPEPDSQLHSSIIPRVIEEFAKHCHGGKILDVGCGFCFGAKMLRDAGFDVTPISILQEEVDNAKSIGFDSFLCDMHDTEQLGKFDAVWLRHVAEHSPCPLLLLSTIAKQAEWIYLEVPLPETVCRHELNPNHYSCLTPGGWQNIITQSGFEIVQSQDIVFDLSMGKDGYLYFICKRKSKE